VIAKDDMNYSFKSLAGYPPPRSNSSIGCPYYLPIAIHSLAMLTAFKNEVDPFFPLPQWK
jgi:hypothetical protein